MYVCGRVFSLYVSLYIYIFGLSHFPILLLSIIFSSALFLPLSHHLSLTLPHPVSQSPTSLTFTLHQVKHWRFCQWRPWRAWSFSFFYFPCPAFPLKPVSLSHLLFPMLMYSHKYCIYRDCELHTHHPRALQLRIEICLGHSVENFVPLHPDGTQLVLSYYLFSLLPPIHFLLHIQRHIWQ